jgi:signal transduction histidine kinase
MPWTFLGAAVSADGLVSAGSGSPDSGLIGLAAKLAFALAWLITLVFLVVLAAKRRDLLRPQTYFLGGALFFLAVPSPLLLGASVWLPTADVAILVQAAKGLTVILAAITLWSVLPLTLTMPSRADLRAANARLEAEVRERVAVQTALAALNAELERRVAERTAELTRTNAELRDEVANKMRLSTELGRARDLAEGANRVKSMFLASMSHDLRTPLNAIIGFSEMILEEVRGPIGHPKYQSYIGDIHRSGELLLSLINNILDLSKIEAGKRELNPMVVDGKRITEECVTLVAGQIGFGNINPKITVNGDGRIYADQLALRQIVLNLISNAAKFTPADGQISVELAHKDDGGSTMTITDTGIGMDKKGIRNALEPFGQPTLLARPHGSGSGLGLTIVTRLVEAHGGRFAIDSAPGDGTTVTLWFPDPPAAPALDQRPRYLMEQSAGADHQDLVVR